MAHIRIHQFGLGVLLTVIVSAGWVWPALALPRNPAAPQAGRADVITIDGLKAFGTLQRPAVLFHHDKHTQALAKQNKDCSACHETVKDRLALKFKRLEDTDKQTVMNTYHDNCIACHKKSKALGQKSGPVTCGQCHVRNGAAPPSSWRPMGFDKALHYRHIKANDKKCELCHHEYNPRTKALFYAKGQEGACIYCHKEVSQENRIAIGPAAHIACIGCHRRLTAQNKDAGPEQCAGCHDAQQQALIAKPAVVPRLERNQPDVVLVKVAVKDDNPVPVADRMLPVPFDHKAHEGYTDTCRVCHHASFSSCASCHTIAGAKKGGQVKLSQAMHQPDAGASCVGCHNRQQSKPACAGCHSRIETGPSLTTEASCRVCHIPSKAENPYPVDEAAAKAAAAALLSARRPVTETVPADQIPETVTIKRLAKDFEPVVMPHRKIVLKLAELTSNNKMAAYFHTEPTTLCQGCHHNSPGARKPPQCGSCHGRSSEVLNLNRPGLMAAYHQECMQCHERMGLKKPVSRDCTGCHAKRE
jgi:Class III cytochrome C family